MLLTKKLLSFLNRVFDKDPGKFLALRLSYGGGLTWRVENAFLYTTVTGGIGQNLTIDLSQYTLNSLVSHLAAQPGYSVLYVDSSELAQLSARVLLDGSSSIAVSNGDHLYGYTSVLWAFFEAAANELEKAKTQIAEMLKQMSTKTATDIWMDELGGYYGIPRLAGEVDASYGPRIIAEVLRPRANNVAIEAAIKTFTGQSAKVTDVVLYTASLPIHDGTITHNSAWNYQSASQPRYGLFDVEYSYDLINGGDFSAFQQVVEDLIGRLRDAGTHLRALNLGPGVLEDSMTAPNDDSDLGLTVGAPMTDTLTEPTEATSMAGALEAFSDTASGGLDGLAAVIQTTFTYSGQRTHNGAITHLGISTNAEDIGTPGDIPFTGVLTLDGSFTLDLPNIIDGLINVYSENFDGAWDFDGSNNYDGNLNP